MSLASGVTGTYTTAFVVAKTPSSWSAGQTYTITGSVAQGGFQYKFSANGSSIANQAVNQEGSSVVLVGTTSVPVSTWHQINFNGRIAGGSAMGMRIDRASDCSGTCGAFNVVQNVDRLFTNAHNGGEYGAGLTIAEIFIYGGVSTSGLTADETTYNECYIYGKYGI
jgi:hypothetical protein